MNNTNINIRLLANNEYVPNKEFLHPNDRVVKILQILIFFSGNYIYY